MDAFFASVEQREDPRLIGLPIAVGGGSNRGVVAAASYEARKFGVKSAMSGHQAQKLCPELIFIKPNFELYKSVSKEIRLIFSEYTDVIEPLSLDEAYLDVIQYTSDEKTAFNVASSIRAQIKKRTHLNASAGISYNKFLAKLASDVNKPNGQFEITHESVHEFLGQLPVKRFFGIGKVTAEKFKKLGVVYGSDLKRLSLQTLNQHFGKQGVWYYNLARGIDNRKVKNDRVRKSVGAERTFFSDLHQPEDLTLHLKKIAKTVSERCVKNNKSGRTITLKIKYSDFNVITRSKTFETYTSDFTEIFNHGKSLLNSVPNLNKGIRLIGLTVSNFDKQKSPNIQLRLW